MYINMLVSVFSMSAVVLHELSTDAMVTGAPASADLDEVCSRVQNVGCGNNPDCDVCNNGKCSKCKNGFFRASNRFDLCLSCDLLPGCNFCADLEGCQQCLDVRVQPQTFNCRVRNRDVSIRVCPGNATIATTTTAMPTSVPLRAPSSAPSNAPSSAQSSAPTGIATLAPTTANEFNFFIARAATGLYDGSDCDTFLDNRFEDDAVFCWSAFDRCLNKTEIRERFCGLCDLGTTTESSFGALDGTDPISFGDRNVAMINIYRCCVSSISGLFDLNMKATFITEGDSSKNILSYYLYRNPQRVAQAVENFLVAKKNNSIYNSTRYF